MDQWFTIKTKEKDSIAILVKKADADFTNLKLTFDELSKWLFSKGIQHGTRTEVLNQIVQDVEKVEFPAVIAQGILPEDGISAKLVPAVGSETSVEYDVNDKIDFKRLFTIPTVSRGQLLARKRIATEGKPGITVFGKPLPAKKGKDLIVKNGENTVFHQDDLCIYATADGEVSFQSHCIHVYPVYRINGDLSLKTGHIDFVGNVHVTGDVPSGFKIQAKGDIRIEGLVEAAEIITPGSVVIAGGVLGQGKGMIRCGGNFTSLYVNQGTIWAGENIEVAQSILYSQCEAGQDILCLSGKGNISGGTIKAGNKISANEIGNETYTKTFIYMETKEIDRKQLMEIEEKINELQKNLIKLQQLKDVMLKQVSQKADAAAQATVNRIQMTLNQTSDQLAQLYLEKNSLSVQQNEASHIFVKGILHPNVEIGIGKYKRKTQSPFQASKVFMKDKEIVIHSI
jgi:uncharacterized protein (DUF342 family)